MLQPPVIRLHADLPRPCPAKCGAARLRPMLGGAVLLLACASAAWAQAGTPGAPGGLAEEVAGAAAAGAPGGAAGATGAATDGGAQAAAGAAAGGGHRGSLRPASASEGFSYGLGLAVIDAPTYSGASAREVKLRPLWTVRYGRFRVSGARASALLGDVSGERRSGVQADLLESDRWSLGLGLRFDNGRKPGDDPVLAGLPEIRSTLRARLALGLQIGGGWSSTVAVSSDLLGREGGKQLGLGLDYGFAPWAGARASVGVGATLADRQHMQTHYGIAPEVAARTGRTAYSASAGLLDLHTGAWLRMPLSSRWSLTGALNLAQLQGDAQASPLTRQRTAVTVSVALGWRSR